MSELAELIQHCRLKAEEYVAQENHEAADVYCTLMRLAACIQTLEGEIPA
jgi:hypothetical protein